GFALQFYGIPLSPVQIRDALRFERWPQQGIVDPADRSGAEEVNGFSCLPDVNPDEDVNNVEGYPNARQAAGGILTQGFLGFDQFNTELKQVYVIRGSHVHGNIFSVRAFDSVFY